MRSPLVSLSRLGAPDCPLGSTRRVWSEYVTPVPWQAAEFLGVKGATVVQRVLALLVHGEIVVVATSYLPTELVDDSTRHDRPWENGDVDALALAGHTVTPGCLEERVWPATPGEIEAFRLHDEAAVTMLSQRYDVNAGRHRLTAGVILVAPSERLVLRSEPERSKDDTPTILLVPSDEQDPSQT